MAVNEWKWELTALFLLFSTNLRIQSVTLKFVEGFGGGAEGWRIIAIIYAVNGLIVNTISVFSVRELSEEELNENNVQGEKESSDRYLCADAVCYVFMDSGSHYHY